MKKTRYFIWNKISEEENDYLDNFHVFHIILY